MLAGSPRLGRPGARDGCLPGPVGALGRVRDPRPLSGLPSDRADTRAARDRRDRAACSAARQSRSQRSRTTRPSLAPVFAWIEAIAASAAAGAPSTGPRRFACGGRSAAAAAAVEAAWSARSQLNGARDFASVRRRALAGAFPLAVAALNRAGLGPLRADISAAELRRAGLRAMGEVAARLDLGDAYVIFGHTHRAGPLPGDLRRRSGSVAPARG